MKKFNRNIIIGITSIMLLFLPVAGVSLYSLWKVVGDHNKLIGTYAESLLLAQDLRRHVVQQAAMMPAFVLTGDPETLKEFEGANAEFTATLEKLDSLVEDAEGDQLILEMRRLQRRLYESGRPGILLKQKGATTAQVNAFFRSKSGPEAILLAGILDRFSRKTSDAFEREKNQTERDSQALIKVLAVASVLTICFLVLLGGLLVKLLRQKRIHDEANEQLALKERQLSQSRKETVEVVAHDLKNPIASIIMSTELAMDWERAHPEAGQDLRMGLEITMRAAHSMQGLIGDLLDHAKIESGMLTLDTKDCQPEKFLADLMPRFELLASQKEISMQLQVPPKLPKVAMDEGRIEQVLSNLIGNALKFTPRGGLIQVGAELVDRSLVLFVKDNGPGISAEQCEHIFERYWQARGTARLGTGLGLAISKAIAQAHGGKIWVESRMGQGSAFYVLLPLKNAVAPRKESFMGQLERHRPQEV